MEFFKITDETCQVENLVFTCKVNTNLNLNNINKKLLKQGSQFNFRKFAAVIVRSQDPKIAVLIFSPGKIVCTGAKTKILAEIFVERILKVLNESGYNLESSDMQIENLVESVELPVKMNLNKLKTYLTDWCGYRVDNFPGAILRIPKFDPITLLIFESGKVVITGATDREDAQSKFQKVLIILKYFAVGNGEEFPLDLKNTFLNDNSNVNNNENIIVVSNDNNDFIDDELELDIILQNENDLQINKQKSHYNHNKKVEKERTRNKQIHQKKKRDQLSSNFKNKNKPTNLLIKKKPIIFNIKSADNMPLMAPIIIKEIQEYEKQILVEDSNDADLWGEFDEEMTLLDFE